MKTTALAEDSAVSRMVRLVEEAQTQRSRTEMLVEQIAKYYTPGRRVLNFHIFTSTRSSFVSYFVPVKCLITTVKTSSRKYPVHS